MSQGSGGGGVCGENSPGRTHKVPASPYKSTLPSPYLCHRRGKQRTDPRRHNSELVRLAQFLSKHQALWAQADIFTPQGQSVCCTCIVIPAPPPQPATASWDWKGGVCAWLPRGWLGAGLGGLIPTGCKCFFTGGPESHRTPQGRRVNLHFL